MSADLPPEAFTRETLQEAFEWLQTQPDLVQNNIHTKERLVALYRRAQRLNDGDHPVSSKKFITDLKRLSGSLDQFSGTPQTPNDLQPPPEPKEPVSIPLPPPIPEVPPAQTQANPEPPTAHETTTETVKKASFEVTTNTRQTTKRGPAPLDGETENRISQVQQRFNLSSREEALRLLVSLGYEKFTEIP